MCRARLRRAELRRHGAAVPYTIFAIGAGRRDHRANRSDPTREACLL